MMTYQAGYEQIKKFIEDSIDEWRNITSADEISNCKPVLDTLNTFLGSMQTKLDAANQTPIGRDNLFRVIGSLNTISGMKVKAGWFSAAYNPTICTAQIHQCILRATEIYGEAEWANRPARSQQPQEPQPGNGNNEPDLRASVLALQEQMQLQVQGFESTKKTVADLAENNKTLEQENTNLRSQLDEKSGAMVLFQKKAEEVENQNRQLSATLVQTEGVVTEYKQREQQILQIFNIDMRDKTHSEVMSILQSMAQNIGFQRQQPSEPRKAEKVEEIKMIAKYQNIPQMPFTAYEVPKDKQLLSQWSKSNLESKTNYEKYKLDNSVSPAVYFAILQLQNYYMSLNSSDSSANMFSKSVMNEKQAVTTLIYHMLDESLEEPYSQKSWNAKVLSMKDKFKELISEGLVAQLIQISSQDFSDVLPQEALQTRLRWMNTLASDDNLLPKNPAKAKEYAARHQAVTTEETARVAALN